MSGKPVCDAEGKTTDRKSDGLNNAMAKSIHISTAHHILNSGDPVDISIWKSDGSILELHNVISLCYDVQGEWRKVKVLSSSAIRKIRVYTLSRVTSLEVFL